MGRLTLKLAAQQIRILLLMNLRLQQQLNMLKSRTYSRMNNGHVTTPSRC